jgi:hypothetical protein
VLINFYCTLICFSTFFGLFLILTIINLVFQICILNLDELHSFLVHIFLLFLIVIRFSFFSLFFSYFDCYNLYFLLICIFYPRVSCIIK